MAAGHQEIVSEFIRYLAELGRSPATREDYTNTLRRLEYWVVSPPPGVGLDSADLLSATKDHLRAWRSSLTVADSSVRTYAAAARSFYAWALREGRIPLDPAAGMPLPRRQRGLPRPIDEDDLELAVDTAPPRERICLVLAGEEGLRAGELAELDRSWILDTARPRVIVIVGKGGKQRIVPLSDNSWRELVAFGLPRRGIVISRKDGKPGPNTPARISHMCNAHLRGCGIEASFHQCRHRFGTAAYRASKDLRQVQELMGHASPQTTSGYAQYDQPDAARTIEAIQLRGRRLRAVRDRRPDEDAG